jgi:hypothetical protein
VPVFGVGECDGTHYYAMQFIPGEGLDKVLNDLRRLRHAPGDPTAAALAPEESVAHSLLTGRFAPPPAPAEEAPARSAPSAPTAGGAHGSSTLSAGGPEADYFRGIARVAVQVADGLAYAHRQGILHRDVKPSNLLLDQQGTVWITDFGLAKAEGADDLTQTGDIVGTVRFMAPERFDGRSMPESDVYALGVTLYELLTLRAAFDDTNKGRLVNKVLHDPPPPPRRFDPRIPRDLETVVLKCVAKDPAERYASAEALAEDLRRFLADRPIQARRTPWYERSWRWARRNPVVATLLLAVLGLLAVVAGVSTRAAVRLQEERNNVQAKKDQLDRAYQALERSRGEEKSAKEDALVRLREARLAQAQAGRRSDQVGRRFNSLAALADAARLRPGLELRNEAAACLTLVDVRPAPGQQTLPSAIIGPCFERHARVDNEGNIVLRSLADDRELLRLRCPGRSTRPEAWSPDGRYLAVVDNDGRVGEFVIWNLSRPEKIHRPDHLVCGKSPDVPGTGRIAVAGRAADPARAP